jgi:hypothetical protein
MICLVSGMVWWLVLISIGGVLLGMGGGDRNHVLMVVSGGAGDGNGDGV